MRAAVGARAVNNVFTQAGSAARLQWPATGAPAAGPPRSVARLRGWLGAFLPQHSAHQHTNKRAGTVSLLHSAYHRGVSEAPGRSAVHGGCRECGNCSALRSRRSKQQQQQQRHGGRKSSKAACWQRHSSCWRASGGCSCARAGTKRQMDGMGGCRCAVIAVAPGGCQPAARTYGRLPRARAASNHLAVQDDVMELLEKLKSASNAPDQATRKVRGAAACLHGVAAPRSVAHSYCAVGARCTHALRADGR